jgi:glycosyltransferase involved in cell wall biosynthesis
MMRVALLQSETRFTGGIETVTQGILQYPNWDGIKWYPIFLRPGQVVDRVSATFPPCRMAVLDSGRLRQVPRTMMSIGRIAWWLKRWKINAVVSQGFHAQCYGGWAARLAGAKGVFWCHNLLRPEQEGRDCIVRLALRSPADMVIGAPRSNLHFLRQSFAGKCPVRLVYPAHPLDEFSNGDGARIRQEFGFEDDTPVAAIVGRLQPWKGQDVFLRAAAAVMQRIPDVRFMVVGGAAMPGDREFEAKLKGTARELGIGERVVFTGERHDISDIMAAADVVVHASVDAEPFGLVVIEAITAGRAVIAANAGGPAEIIEQEKSGLLTTPGDDAELAAAMIRVLSDRDLRQRLGRGAVERVESRFTFRRMADDLTCVLDEVTSTRIRGKAAAIPGVSRRVT